MELYGYVTQSGYMGRINKDPEDWIIFPTEEEYVNYMKEQEKGGNCYEVKSR